MRVIPKAAALAAALAVLLSLPSLSLAGKGKNKAPGQPASEEQATLILDQACKALAGLKSYSFQANVTLDKVYQDGSKIQSGRSMAVTVTRPGAFRIVTEGDEFQAVSVFDGKTFSLALPDRKIYGQIPAALDADGLMDMLATQYGLESPLGDLLSNDPCAKMDAKAGFYVGKAKVEGALCHHLFFQGKDVDWQLWIEDAPSGLPRKMVITEKKLPMAPQFTAVLSGWKTGENAMDQFVFTPPAGYARDDGVIIGARRGK